MKGKTVDTYDGLYNVLMKEHIFSNCHSKLHQHLVDSNLSDPRQLGKATDVWVNTGVPKKSQGGDPKKRGSAPLQEKEGSNKNKKEFSPKLQKSTQPGESSIFHKPRWCGYKGKKLFAASKAGICLDCHKLCLFQEGNHGLAVSRNC